MPTYEYHCPSNGERVEVLHSMRETVATWGELCAMAGIDLKDTAPETPVRKVITAPGIAFPKSPSELKNMGFTKLVRREKGVYENVTARDGESRYMTPDNPNSVPDLSKTIRD